MPESEIENIISRYKRRESKGPGAAGERNLVFENFRNTEREEKYRKIILSKYNNLSNLTVLEIGAGDGVNISFFKGIGIPPENIWANELLLKRIEILNVKHNDINILPGNALDLNIEKEFDIVLQSMVFSSILNENFRIALAEKLTKMTKDGGIILWYDFIYNNPWNKDVKGIGMKETRKLFPNTLQIVYKVTLMPQISRLIGQLYPLMNRLFPFLRTHIITSIQKG